MLWEGGAWREKSADAEDSAPEALTMARRRLAWARGLRVRFQEKEGKKRGGREGSQNGGKQWRCRSATHSRAVANLKNIGLI